ncbi:MAG: hypothetical protein RJA57_1271 [Bacteroidota bacterium]
MTVFFYFFIRTTPRKKETVSTEQHGPGDGHEHGSTPVTIDTILNLAKKQLGPQQLVWVNTLENSISRGAIRSQQLAVYRSLASFWADSARIFEPYAWYTAEAARLENSEKSLTFAAQLFLVNLQADEITDRKKWKALQAKDLFERSLQLNPANDSARIGLGATLLFGDLSDTPMEGIQKIREVVQKDSLNVYAQLTLGRASILSGQYDKALDRLQTVNRLEPDNLEGLLLLAEVQERMGRKQEAVEWYRKSLRIVKDPAIVKAINDRIGVLSK